jgi:UDP-3-O-[3-hydroxymyristoyl] glucosamine N-acyltransferase
MRLKESISLKKIAKQVNGRFIGDAHLLISGINEIHMVSPGDLTFVDHPKYYEKALKSKATAILINNEMEPPAGKGLIIHDDPFAAYVSLVKLYSHSNPLHRK